MNLQPRLILPLMMFLGVLIIGVRVNDVFDSMRTGKLFSAVQQVQASSEKKAEEHAAPAPAAAKEEPAKPAEQQAQAPAKTEAAPQAKPADAKEKTASRDDGPSAESELYRQLAGRRDQLDKRASELDEREALAMVTEKRIDQKLKEMETLKKQLETLVGQASAAQQAQLENLVKIYETMKPKEAAKIFEALEMPVLLGVVQKMKPARTAPILAEMNPERAKEITTALTKQDQLPKIK